MTATPTYRDAIAEAIEAVAISSLTTYAWFGQPVEVLPPSATAVLGADGSRAYLLFNLQQRLYGDFYCQGRASPRPSAPASAQIGWSPFIESLSLANTGYHSRESGWIVVAFDDGIVVVERDGLRIWVRREELAQRDGDVIIGADIDVLVPKELLRLSPGFYMALGNIGLDVPTREPIVRLYWNLVSAGAGGFVEAATTGLNQAHVPFRLKVVNHPSGFTRCDAGVLYILRRDFDRVAPIVAEVHGQVRATLKAGTPAFSKPLGWGLGLAEEPPGSTESFGMARCRIVAAALVNAFERGLTGTQARLNEVIAGFEQAALDPDRPYLLDRSRDEYPSIAGIGD